MANAIELIKSPHRKVEQLYNHYQGANGQTQQKQSIIREICYQLTFQAMLKGDIFYPLVERNVGMEGASLVKEALKEHNDLKHAIDKLQANQFTGPGCEQVFQEMRGGVQHHVKEEESEMLPYAQQRLGTENACLDRQMRQRKQEFQTPDQDSGS